MQVIAMLAALLINGASHAEDANVLSQIDALQNRADVLVIGGPGAENYHLAKARTLLDFALSEYHENEKYGIVAETIERIESLLSALENNQVDIPMNPIMAIADSEIVRQDMWEEIAALKNKPHFSCGQRSIAEAEVQLVWAGHEKQESSWAHAQSYAQSAEELLRDAQSAIKTCAKNYPVEQITLANDTLFAFDNANLDPSAYWRLNRLADTLLQQDAKLEKITLVGHTDRLRSDGIAEKNQKLSEQRAESIKEYLIGKNIPADKIFTSGAGSSQPLVMCSARQSKEKQIACLTPNRRVEIMLYGTRLGNASAKR